MSRRPRSEPHVIYFHIYCLFGPAGGRRILPILLKHVGDEERGGLVPV